MNRSAVPLAPASRQLFLAAGGTVLGRSLTGSRGRVGAALLSAVVVSGPATRLLLRG
ncbi:hypothetical protein [Streptomyces decoyicus]|uniref:hypothetical protein n=1 Tax=Streptomyces decoyicus TaxID=249567 RepID=UPI001AE0B960|nr:hypothetical protein [Streptomyces decoyicus]QZY19191.1 hypothetical protein K7C20_31490 [Streptomyces decoyicus]